MSNFDLDIAVSVRHNSNEYRLIATNVESQAIIRAVLVALFGLTIDAVVVVLNWLVGWIDDLPAYYAECRRVVLYWITPEIGIRPAFA